MSGIPRRASGRGVVGAAAVVAVAVAGLARAAEPVEFTVVPAGDYANFPVNWDSSTVPVFHGLIRTPEQYAAVFHPAPVMRSTRPFAPPPEFFAEGMLLFVVRVIPAPAAAETPLAVESLVADGDDLVLRYRFVEPAAEATYTVKQALVVRLPRRPVATVRFIENGEPAGDLRLTEGRWAVPPPATD